MTFMLKSLLLALLVQGSNFDAAAGAFTGCLINTVKMGMMTKTKPDDFAASLAKSCKDEEAQFRLQAVAAAVAQGRTPTEAWAEVDGNITNARRVFAADQARYVATGKVPR